MYAKIFKTSEGAKKAWASRQRSSGSETKPHINQAFSTGKNFKVSPSGHYDHSVTGPSKAPKKATKYDTHNQLLGDLGVIQ